MHMHDVRPSDNTRTSRQIKTAQHAWVKTSGTADDIMLLYTDNVQFCNVNKMKNKTTKLTIQIRIRNSRSG